jgi:predicted transcriptional regulator
VVIDMMESTLRVLDDEDREFADILRSLGMQRNTAILITYLASAGEATSREIELGAGLRQPEVSIAMRDLRGKNWVGEREVKTGGKGRPSLVYTLTTPIDEIIKHIEDEKLREHAEVMESIRKLKERVASWC